MPKAEKTKEQKGKTKSDCPLRFRGLGDTAFPALTLVDHTSDMTAGQGSLR